MKKNWSSRLVSAVLLAFLIAGNAAAQLTFDLGNSCFIEFPFDTAGVFAGQKGPFGGISSIAYSGKGNDYYLLSDGLPARYYTFSIEVTDRIVARFKEVSYLGEEKIRGEGMAPGKQLCFISDERRIGNQEATRIWTLRANGMLQQLGGLPPRYYGEMYDNSGFEGLSLSPSGRKLFAAMERALPGSACRQVLPIVEYNLADHSIATHYYPMQWPGSSNGISALLATGDSELLVIERDYLPEENRNEVAIFSVTTGSGGADNNSDCPLADDPVLVPQPLFAFGKGTIELGGRPYKVNNIEGATFSADGQYLLLVSDNNFGNKGAKTPTQLVALKVKNR